MFNAPFIQKSIEHKIFRFMKNENQDVDKIILFIEKLKKFMKSLTDSDISYKHKIFELFIKRNAKCLDIKNKLYQNQIKNNYSIKESFKEDKELYIKQFNLGCCLLTIHEVNSIL